VAVVDRIAVVVAGERGIVVVVVAGVDCRARESVGKWGRLGIGSVVGREIVGIGVVEWG